MDCSHLLKKSITENFIICAVIITKMQTLFITKNIQELWKEWMVRKSVDFKAAVPYLSVVLCSRKLIAFSFEHVFYVKCKRWGMKRCITVKTARDVFRTE